jgi:hypothetical protein
MPAKERHDAMNRVFDYIAAHSGWLVAFVPFLCLIAYFAIQSRWDAYSRRKNYEELEILHKLREKNIITQAEYDEKKEELLSV